MMHNANALLDADYLSASASRTHNGNGQSRNASQTGSPSKPHFTPQTTPMKIAPHFCPANADPFSTGEWDSRTAQIKDENGKVRSNRPTVKFRKTEHPLLKRSSSQIF